MLGCHTQGGQGALCLANAPLGVAVSLETNVRAWLRNNFPRAERDLGGASSEPRSANPIHRCKIKNPVILSSHHQPRSMAPILKPTASGGATSSASSSAWGHGDNFGKRRPPQDARSAACLSCLVDCSTGCSVAPAPSLPLAPTHCAWRLSSCSSCLEIFSWTKGRSLNQN